MKWLLKKLKQTSALLCINGSTVSNKRKCGAAQLQVCKRPSLGQKPGWGEDLEMAYSLLIIQSTIILLLLQGSIQDAFYQD